MDLKKNTYWFQDYYNYDDGQFVYEFPCRLLFGPGVLNKLHEQELPGKKPLVISYAGLTRANNQNLDRVMEQLEKAGNKPELFDKIGSNPEEPLIMEGAEAFKKLGCDYIVGLGGGAILDAATLIATAAGQKDGRLWDYVQGGSGGRRQLEYPAVPYIEITTTAGTGSEVDPFGVVSNPDTDEKVGFTGSFPEMAVVDPELMLTVPPRVTAYTGFDAMYHCLEGLFSSLRTPYSEMIGRQGVKEAAGYIVRAVRNGSDIEARTHMAFANVMGGYSMCMANCVGIHVIANQISGFYHDVPHGMAIAMISPAYYEYLIRNKACSDEFFVDLAKLLGKEDATEPMDMVRALRKLCDDTGISEVKMSDYGIDPAKFPEMVANGKALTPGQFEIEPIYPTDDAMIEVLRNSYK